MNKIVVLLALVFFGTVMLSAIPISQDDFTIRSAANYYLANGLEKTGSANIVNSIIWDFRAYDTLGEETVLFIAASGLCFLMLNKKEGEI